MGEPPGRHSVIVGSCVHLIVLRMLMLGKQFLAAAVHSLRSKKKKK